jgi:hypothetical protein
MRCLRFLSYSILLLVASTRRIFGLIAPPSFQCVSRFSLALKASIEPDKETNYDAEETLLRLRLAVEPSVSMDEAKKRVVKYSQSFPFSVVLPVQPLMYVPTPDDGVEVRFLRKKTDFKSGVDGGIRFFIEATPDNCLELTAKRNSVGQSIAKMVAERLVITSYVSGITGKDDERFGPPPTDVVRMQSVFHKWM